jgi:hypothetical protein
MKTYTKTHQSKKALNSHIAKIKARGGEYLVNGYKIRYSFPQQDNNELPSDTQQQVNEGKVTYRGCGISGKNAGMYKLKVHNKEYIVSLDTLKSFEKGDKKIRFDAPFRKH